MHILLMKLGPNPFNRLCISKICFNSRYYEETVPLSGEMIPSTPQPLVDVYTGVGCPTGCTGGADVVKH